MHRLYAGKAEFLVVYIREAHPIDSNWGDPSVPVIDPTTDLERLGVARKCAASLNLSVPMAVDGVDDNVSMAYNAWPERLYIVKPDGTIAYKGGLGPSGFKPAECSAALAKLLGEKPPALAAKDPGPPSDCEDDGFSGLWTGNGSGMASRNQEWPVRLQVALGADGTVGGRMEITAGRQPVPFAGAKFDAGSGRFSASVALGRGTGTITGTVDGKTLKADLTVPGGQSVFHFEVTRTQIGYPLVPGPENAAGTWAGTATAKDPALQGKPVVLELTAAGPTQLTGTVVIDGKRAEILRGRYVAKTGDLRCRARAADGVWQVVATVRGTKATGMAMMPGVALAVEFAVTLKPATAPKDEPEPDIEDF